MSQTDEKDLIVKNELKEADVQPWKVLKREVYKHSDYRYLEDVEFELPDGRVETYSLKKDGSCVSVLAITKEKKVVLARQYRPGPNLVLDELPAGGIEPGEDPKVAAERELLEETGYRCEKLTFLSKPVDCAYTTITRYAYLAEGCEKVAEQDLDENEFIEVIEKSIPDFVKQLEEGSNTDLEVAWHGLLKLGVLKIAEDFT